MANLRILSPAEQVAMHLEEALLHGTWRDTMPGAPLLAAELGIDPKTADAALRLLETRGLLVAQGPGRRRRIDLSEGLRKGARRQLRIGIFIHDPLALTEGYIFELQHLLHEAGFSTFFSVKCLMELRMNVKRVARLVKQTDADAWVVVGGSRDVLGWFSEQELPAFALFGRHGGLQIAGTRPEKVPAYHAAIDRLVELGHRRITLLARSARRLPEPGRSESAFLKRLQFHGIPTGPFNLPDWKDDMEGFQALLAKLFQFTPPTALIIQLSPLFSAAHHFIARRGLRIPEDVSLVCSDADSSFAWCVPAISHIHWESGPVVRRIVRWAENIARGEVDFRQTLTHAMFVEGGTIGPSKD